MKQRAMVLVLGLRVVYGGTMIGAAERVNPCRVVPFVAGTAAGDAALMLALQPRAVGKPFWGSRVFEMRDGAWMMAESYQVTIQDMPPF